MLVYFIVILRVIFQSTPPARGATSYVADIGTTIANISIHAPREGGDPGELARTGNSNYFNPRPPRGGRHQYLADDVVTNFISIHAPREGGDLMFLRRVPWCFMISIHAPREGGDFAFAYVVNTDNTISIHAPREGGDSKDAQFYL